VKACIFCGNTDGRATVEHVIPQWVRRRLDPGGSLELFAGEAPGSAARRQVAKFQHLNITLRGVICERCNNDYLSQLESAVRPVLSPMIFSASATVLTPADQALLATWAVKTVLLFELAIRQQYPATRPIDGYEASAAEFAWLWANRSPPPRALVWLGCWDCKTTTPVMFEPSGAPLPTADGHPVVGHLTTFALGYVAFQVFSVDFVAADEHAADHWNASVPVTLKKALFRTWPPGPQDVSWPPPAFANDDWRRLVTWDGLLRPKSTQS
jgi:hypothetical protein